MMDTGDLAYFAAFVVVPVVIAATGIGVALILVISLFSGLANVLDDS